MQLTEQQKSEGWRIVKFGDVAQEVKASTKDPLGEGIERYIGLEHIDPESLRLARYGLIAEDNPTFTKKFSAGDILFGRRRAYLKKAAVADFDGICSGDITVIAPKGEDLVPDLLPFIVQSEPFFDWAVKHSAGGLSPRTKFKSLAEFEFPLPPRPRQEEILEVLKQTENVKNQTEDLIETGIKTFRVMCRNILQIIPQRYDEIEISNDWKIKKLEDISKVERGKFTPRPRNNPIYYDGQYPFVQTGDVKEAFVFLDKHSQTLNEKGLAVSKIFPKDTILITIAANIGDVALTTYDVACTDSVVAIRPEDNIEPLWLIFYLMTLQPYLDSIATESAQKNINLQVLRPLKINVPPRDFQKQSSEKLKSFFEIIKNYQKHLIDIRKMQNLILFEKLS